MKKIHCISIAAIVILLTTCPATLTFAKMASPNVVNSGNSRNIGAGNNRLLRTGPIGDENNQGGISDEEDRGMPSGKIANLVSTWKQKTFFLDQLDDEVAKIAGYTLLNNKMFRAIKQHGETPQTLYKNFGIRGKIRAMNEEDLLKDGNFMLWREFAEWWGKNGKNV